MDEERVKRNRCRKGFVARNVLGVINFDGYWIYVLVGWEYSAHDGQVFNDALLRGLPVLRGNSTWGVQDMLFFIMFWSPTVACDTISRNRRKPMKVLKLQNNFSI
jgi:hypothetical protein